MQPALALRGVTKRFGRAEALRDVTFSLPPGAFAALLGANGAGKTTLVQMVTGLFTPDEGEILTLGHDMRRHAPAALAGLGVVFQAQTLDLELSLLANLRFHARLHGLPKRDREPRIEALLHRFGLMQWASQPARTLSGGNRRRLELARALLHRPRLLVMDEATVGLDPPSRRDLLLQMQALRAQEGTAILWTTHLLDEAEHADRLLILDHGRLIHDGPPAEALSRTGAPTLPDAFDALRGAQSAQGDA